MKVWFIFNWSRLSESQKAKVHTSPKRGDSGRGIRGEKLERPTRGGRGKVGAWLARGVHLFSQCGVCRGGHDGGRLAGDLLLALLLRRGLSGWVSDLVGLRWGLMLGRGR